MEQEGSHPTSAAPPEKPGWMGQLSAAAAVLGAFIAVGQTASQIVQGYYSHETELAKAKQDLELAQRKSDNDLASTFLTFILKDATEQQQSLLYDALSTLKTHPLREWAQNRHEAIEKGLAGLKQARDAQIAAYQQQDEASRAVDSLQAQIQQNQFQSDLHREDTEYTQKLLVEQLELARQLGVAKAQKVRAESKVTILKADISGDTRVQVSAKEITSFHLPLDKIRSALSVPTDRVLYERYMPALEAALVEARFTNRSTAAAVVAVAAYETALFSAVTEYGNGDINEGKSSLGNTQAGDGERFKGRGLIQLFGRTNYTRYSQLLGLGSLLVDSPDEANRPEIAARILCTYFKIKGLDMVAEQDDIDGLFHKVSGAGAGPRAQTFREYYSSIKAVLDQQASAVNPQ